MEEAADVPYEGVVSWLLCRRLLPEDYHQRLKGEDWKTKTKQNTHKQPGEPNGRKSQRRKARRIMRVLQA